MNIVITGANGFLGKIIHNHLINLGHNVHPLSRDNINLLCEGEMEDYFLNNDIDIVFHTAITGGRRTKKDTEKDFYNNIKMFEILDSLSTDVKLLFNFASGAEYDRSQEIFYLDEDDLGNKIPFDFYGMSKYIISKQALSSKNKWVNLRIFNCFGTSEKEDRMIKSAILNKLRGEKITVHQNKYMDFFYDKDLLRVIDFYLDNMESLQDLPRDVNLSYGRHNPCPTLYSIAEYIDTFSEPKVGIEVNQIGYSKSYCGNDSTLRGLSLDLNGIKKSIRLMYNDLNKTNNDVKSYSEEQDVK